MESEPQPSAYPALTVRIRVLILVLVVGQFLVAHGQIWKTRFAWDRSILWSYATIPALVAVALAIRRRLGLISWFLHTLEIACAKFLITASILLGILIATRNEPPPPRPVQVHVAPGVATPKQAPKPTPIDSAQTATISGAVRDSHGAPSVGAMVFVQDGLDGFVFAPSERQLHIENDGRGFAPEISVAQAGQPILARSTDGHLHTLLLKAQTGNWVRNIPLLASGVPNSLPSSDMDGVFSLQCTVHGSREAGAWLGIFRHPFEALVGGNGRFELKGVPAVPVRVGAFRGGTFAVSGNLQLQPLGNTEVDLTLHANP